MPNATEESQDTTDSVGKSANADLLGDQVDNASAFNPETADNVIKGLQDGTEGNAGSSGNGGTDVSESTGFVPPPDTTGNTESTLGVDAGNATLRDSGGTIFDPAYHYLRDGKPAVTSTGRFRKRRSGPSHYVPPTVGQPTVAVNDPRLETSARVCAEGFFTIGVALFGEEWQPQTNERTNVTQAFADYFRVRGSPDLPPEAILIMGLAGYAMPRLFMPQTKEKLAAWMGKKPRKPVTNTGMGNTNAQPDFRPNGIGENHSSTDSYKGFSVPA